MHPYTLADLLSYSMYCTATDRITVPRKNLPGLFISVANQPFFKMLHELGDKETGIVIHKLAILGAEVGGSNCIPMPPDRAIPLLR